MTDFEAPEQVKGVIRKYCDWLNGVSPCHARKWGLLCNNSLEAGAMEAVAWAVLRDCGAEVLPYDDPSSRQKRPDFVCLKDGTKFYTEVTCVSTDKVVEETGFAGHFDPSGGAQSFGLLTDAVFAEVRNKAPQCAGLDGPCILFVGTFHFRASATCVHRHFVEELLTGKTGIGFRFDPVRGEAVGPGFQSTSLESSSFIRSGKGSLIEPARCSVSALVLAGVGCWPPEIRGVLHPEAARPFDVALLPRIAFARLVPGYKSGDLRVEWLNETSGGD